MAPFAPEVLQDVEWQGAFFARRATEGIQPSIILEIEDAIADLKKNTTGMSILLVEQYVDFAMRLADTYAVMDVGRIVAAGPTATFERERMQQLMSV
jgi:urea transport system ATP-binding protein